MTIMYYNEITKQLVPIADNGTIVSKNDSKAMTPQVYTAASAGAILIPSAFEACAGFRTLSVFLKAANPAILKVQWSFDGVAVDGEEDIFNIDIDRVPKTLNILAPYFRLVATNNHTATQDITVKSYLVA